LVEQHPSTHRAGSYSFTGGPISMKPSLGEQQNPVKSACPELVGDR